jgi:hypothetical protein
MFSGFSLEGFKVLENSLFLNIIGLFSKSSSLKSGEF